MTFHTIRLVKALSYNEYEIIFRDTIKYCKENHKEFYELDKKNKRVCVDSLKLSNTSKNHSQYICEALKGNGIIIHFINYFSKDKGNTTVYFGLQLIANPSQLKNINNKYELATNDEVQLYSHLFNLYTRQISDSFPSFEEFSLNRIDYSVNKYFKSQDEAELVMSILKRSYNAEGYDEYKEYSKNLKEFVPPKDSIYLFNKSMRINIYLKYCQVTKHYINDQVNDPKGLIRYEIQCNPSKLYNLKRIYDLEELSLIQFLDEKMYLDIFTFYFKKIFRTGNYFKYDIAKRIIEENDELSKKQKKVMLELLKLASMKGKRKDVKEAFCASGYNENKYKRMLKLFDKININPITIPRRWNLDVVFNPIEIIKSSIS